MTKKKIWVKHVDTKYGDLLARFVPATGRYALYLTPYAQRCPVGRDRGTTESVSSPIWLAERPSKEEAVLYLDALSKDDHFLARCLNAAQSTGAFSDERRVAVG